MMDMMLTGRTYSAAEGMALGLSQYVVGEGEGLAKAIALAERIAQNAGLTNFALIQALPRIVESDRSAGFFTEALMAAIAQSATRGQGPRAGVSGQEGRQGHLEFMNPARLRAATSLATLKNT